MGLFLYLFVIDLAVYDVLVAWHLVADHEFGAVETVADRPDLEVVAIVDDDVLGVVVDPVGTAVAHLVEELGSKLALVEWVEAEVSGNAAAD